MPAHLFRQPCKGDAPIRHSCQWAMPNVQQRPKKKKKNQPRTSEIFQDSSPDPSQPAAPHLLLPFLEPSLADRECALLGGGARVMESAANTCPSACLQTAPRFLHLPHSSESCDTCRRSLPVGVCRAGKAPGAHSQDPRPPFLIQPRRALTRLGEGHTFHDTVQR